MSFIDDDDLIMDLRNIPPKREPKKVNDSLPMPDDESDSLVIGEDIELTKDISNEELESLVLGDSINTNIHDGEGTFNEDSILKANNIEDTNPFDSIIGSSVVSNISDKGLSLEGGLELGEDGEVDTWSVELDIDYAGSNSDTALESSYDFDLGGVEENFDSKSSISSENTDEFLIEDSIIDYNPLQYGNPPIETINYPVLHEPPIWLVMLIIFTSGVMLLGLLTTFEAMVYSVCCNSGRNCHRPPLIVELITYLLS